MNNAPWGRAGLASLLSAMAFAAAAQTEIQTVDLNIQTSNFVPRAFDKSTVTAVVILSGDPVAVVEGKQGRKLTRAEKDAVKAQRKSEQDAVQPQIEQHGGQVVGSMQSALNAVKVRVQKNQISALRAIPGVVAVKPVGSYVPSNAVSVPFIGAPLAWEAKPSVTGRKIAIAVIDTGIDYTHANFGGPGTVEAFNAAFATSTLPADRNLFGDHAPKVKGGTDLVGDNYDARFNDAAHAAVPDPNPLDCNGHGSHTAGTAAGLGVTAAGATYNGPYNSAIYTPHKFRIGPGVAPGADLYAVRVFGCAGSTNVVSDAIDWAVDNDMDVISMSLGSDFGTADNSETEAIHNATAAGILVVAASGNAGSAPYIASAPGNTDGAISVAAMDATASFPGALLALASGTITAQDSNGAALSGASWPIVVLRNPDNSVSLGCNESEYDPAAGGVNVVGKLVVTMRGNCARVFRAGAGQKHGAAAVAMINSSPGYPPFEGDIPGGDPAANPFDPVTIPFLGIQGTPSTDGNALTAAPTAVATATTVANPTFALAASFSSAGPRYGDSVLKPNTTGPGVAIVSTAVGTGNGAVTESGTSMATPHVAGVSALVMDSNNNNKRWTIDDLRSAVVQTSSPTTMRDYSPRREGAGVVQALAAVNTQAVVRVQDDSVSFGFVDLLADFHGRRDVTIHNVDNKAVTFNVSVTKVSGPATASVTVPSSITVPKHGDATMTVALDIPAAAVGAATGFKDVGGYITFTPANSSMNGGVSLTVPYYLVAFSRSNLSATATGTIGPAASADIAVANTGGVIPGTPSFFSWGLVSDTRQDVAFADTHAVGVRIVSAGGQRAVQFAVNTFDRFSNAAPNEFDILVWTTSPVTADPDFAVIGANLSAFDSTQASGQMAVGVLNLHTGSLAVRFFATAVNDGTTILLPALASDLGLTAAHPRFVYAEQHFSGITGAGAAMPGLASFNAFTPALQVAFPAGAVAPGGTAHGTTVVNAAEWAVTPPRGLMVVAADNKSTAQAVLLPATP